MNRELWNNILQLAVAAPFLYVVSEQQDNAYFKLGLKLIAGAIVIKNLGPVFEEIRPLYVAAQKIKAVEEQQRANAKAKTIDGEAVS